MPKQIMDYSQTKIYKLCCKNTEITDAYVGHTTNPIKRKYQHKSHCNNLNSEKYDYKVYQFIRDNGGWNNWSMIVIEDYPCENRFEAESRERHWIENLNASLNSLIPTRSREEYMKLYKDEYKEYMKKYNIENSEKLRENKKQYNIKNSERIKKHKREKIQCECGCFISKSNISEHRKNNKHLELISNV